MLKQQRVCFYLSDYGYGHASRQISLIREMLKLNKNKKIKIYVKCGHTFEFVKKSFCSDKRVVVIKSKNDVGVVLNQKLEIDLKRTKSIVNKYLLEFSQKVEDEYLFLKKNKIDLVISDIVAQAFPAAQQAEIPAIAITNFTWYDIYSHLFPEFQRLFLLREAYEKATALYQLGFFVPMDYFGIKKEFFILARKATVSKEKMRRELGIKTDDFVVYFSLGMADAQHSLENIVKNLPENYKLIVSCNIDVNININNKRVIQIPKFETESQNYLQICDAVVSKCGYSTFAEALLFKIPILFLRRKGFAEDQITGDKLLEFKVGKEITFDDIKNLGIELKNVEKLKKNFGKLKLQNDSGLIAKDLL